MTIFKDQRTLFLSLGVIHFGPFSLSSSLPFPFQIILKTRTVEQPAEEAQIFALLTILCESSPISVYMWAEPCYSVLQISAVARIYVPWQCN